MSIAVITDYPRVRRRAVRPFWRSDWWLLVTVRMLMIVVLLALIAVFCSEAVAPEAGVLTRVIYGNAVARENVLARRLLFAASIYAMRDDAGRKYVIAVPDHYLTPAEQTAWWAYAARHNYPAWPSFGTFAVDP